jgi:MFS family permease
VLTAISNLFLSFSFQMLLPTLPVLVTQRGGDELAVGLVLSIFTVSALLVRPFAGQLLDTVGRRQMTILGLLIFILCVAGYYWMAAITAILVVRFLHGIGWGITTTAYGTLAADLIPPARRGEGMGYFGLSANLGMALAPSIGIWLIHSYGFGLLFTVSSVFAVLALLLSQFVRFPSPVATPAGQEKPSFWSGLFEKNALFPSLLVLFFGVTYGGIASFITLFGTEAGIANVGVFFFANAGMMMILRPFSGILFDRRGPAWVLLPGAIFTGIGLFLLSHATTTSALILAAIFYGAGFGSIQPTLQAWTINRVAPQRRGAANGTFYSAFDLGISIGAMLLGAVAKATSYAVMYRTSLVFIAMFLLVFVYHLLRQKTK